MSRNVVAVARRASARRVRSPVDPRRLGPGAGGDGRDRSEGLDIGVSIARGARVVRTTRRRGAALAPRQMDGVNRLTARNTGAISRVHWFVTSSTPMATSTTPLTAANQW